MTDEIKIEVVDASEIEVAAWLRYIHELTFSDSAPQPDFEIGRWLIAWNGTVPAAFAGVTNSDRFENHGYFCRVGVAPEHRGKNLQFRLMQAIEDEAKRIGWRGLVSDTTNHNVHSANNFIISGWRIFWPDKPWSFPEAIYWRKNLG